MKNYAINCLGWKKNVYMCVLFGNSSCPNFHLPADALAAGGNLVPDHVCVLCLYSLGYMPKPVRSVWGEGMWRRGTVSQSIYWESDRYFWSKADIGVSEPTGKCLGFQLKWTHIQTKTVKVLKRLRFKKKKLLLKFNKRSPQASQVYPVPHHYLCYRTIKHV